VISVLCLLDGTPQNRIVLDANSSLSAARAQIVDAFGLTGAVGETDIAWIVAANVVGVSTADKAAPVVVADESVVLNEAVKQFSSEQKTKKKKKKKKRQQQHQTTN
jgi:hypothetical protein